MFPSHDDDTQRPAQADAEVPTPIEPAFTVEPVDAEELAAPGAPVPPLPPVTPVADEDRTPAIELTPIAEEPTYFDQPAEPAPAYEPLEPVASYEAPEPVASYEAPEPVVELSEPAPVIEFAPVADEVVAGSDQPAADEATDEPLADTDEPAPAKKRRGFNPKISVSVPRLRRRQGGGRRRTSATVTGLHLEQGEVLAAVASADGGLTLERAAAADLPVGAVRDGEVMDPEALAATLKRLFTEHGLPKRVRVGIANQRTIMRTIDLPPLERDAEIAAAVRMHAPDHIAMPLEQAVLDYQVLGRVDTPEGPRTRAVVVATDRESIDRLLDALRRAGLRPEGVDLSAFGLIRAMHGTAEQEGPVLYAHISGTTTMAIADGTECRFTRLSSAGFDTFAAQLSEQAGVPLDEARHRLVASGLDPEAEDGAARVILQGGAAQLGDDLRTSIEFYATQWGGTVEEVVVTGLALAVPGFVEAIERRVGVTITPGSVAGSAEALGGLEPWRVAVAAGLAVEEVAA
jgi:type IV pilus assembly protein PilM